MRAALLRNKTIAKVHQAPVENTSGHKIYCLEAIEFTDGSVLRFVVVECEDEYGIEPVYPGRAIETKAEVA